MKNLKVSLKLIISFMVIAVLTAVVGVVGIVGMRQIDADFDDMYNMQLVPLPELSKAIEMLQRQRACMREFIIGAAVGDIDLIEDAYSRVLAYRPIMTESMDNYYATVRAPEAIKLFDEARLLYNTEFTSCIENIYTQAKAGVDPAELYALMRESTAATNKIVDDFDICMAMKLDVAAEAAQSSSATADSLLVLIIVILAIALTAAVVFAIYISGLISKPLIPLTGFLKKAGEKGDISLRPEDVNVISNFASRKDELGQCISAAAAFVKHMNDINGELESIANGDLTAEIETLSDGDTMGISLQKMLANLNSMFAEINASTGQVSLGAKQVADGAQSLAQGATQQAASIQQLSSSIAEIAERTKVNAETAGKTSKLSDTIKGSAEKGSAQMDEMIVAVSDINEASKNISKIIKTIDDIAFQTNILALNAAVEAARAGQHGKGFAVVAEEVRNLASKSAEAAKNTGDMIQNSMDKAELGVRIASETAASLSEIVTGIKESSQLIQGIAKSSEEQSTGIAHINVGIDQVAQVVQQNSATAEESAAASEEMSSQSSVLQQLIAQFKVKESSSIYRGLPAAGRSDRKRPALPQKSGYEDAAKAGDFGKY